MFFFNLYILFLLFIGYQCSPLFLLGMSEILKLFYYYSCVIFEGGFWGGLFFWCWTSPSPPSFFPIYKWYIYKYNFTFSVDRRALSCSRSELIESCLCTQKHIFVHEKFVVLLNFNCFKKKKKTRDLKVLKFLWTFSFFKKKIYFSCCNTRFPSFRSFKLHCLENSHTKQTEPDMS